MNQPPRPAGPSDFQMRQIAVLAAQHILRQLRTIPAGDPRRVELYEQFIAIDKRTRS